MESLTKILGWFKAGSEPSEEQFKQSWTSFWHKSEKMPQTQILGLNNALNEKANKEDLSNVIAGLRPMGDALNIADLNTKPKRDNDSYFILDQLDENNNPYIFRYDAILNEWINTKQVVYKDIIKYIEEKVSHDIIIQSYDISQSKTYTNDSNYSVLNKTGSGLITEVRFRTSLTSGVKIKVFNWNGKYGNDCLISEVSGTEIIINNTLPNQVNTYNLIVPIKIEKNQYLGITNCMWVNGGNTRYLTVGYPNYTRTDLALSFTLSDATILGLKEELDKINQKLEDVDLENLSNEIDNLNKQISEKVEILYSGITNPSLLGTSTVSQMAIADLVCTQSGIVSMIGVKSKTKAIQVAIFNWNGKTGLSSVISQEGNSYTIDGLTIDVWKKIDISFLNIKIKKGQYIGITNTSWGAQGSTTKFVFVSNGAAYNYIAFDYTVTNEGSLSKEVRKLSEKVDSLTSSSSIPDVLRNIDVLHILMYGQSLSVGANATPVTAFNGFSNGLMFRHIRTYDFGYEFGISKESYAANPATYDNQFYVLNKLAEAGGYGNNSTKWDNNSSAYYETPCVGFMEGLNEMIKNNNGDFLTNLNLLFSAAGSGGQQIKYLMKAGSPGAEPTAGEFYSRMIKDVSKAKGLCDSKGLTYKVGCMAWVQGESDYNTPNYNALMSQLLLDLNTDVKMITGQSEDIIAISYQHTQTKSALSLFDMSINNVSYEKFKGCIPFYDYPLGGDNLHLTATGSRLLGNRLGFRYFELLKENRIRPLYVTNYSILENNVILTFNDSVRIDKETMANQGVNISEISNDCGFKSYSGIDNIVTSVEQLGDYQLKLICSTIPANLKYGLNHDGTPILIPGSIRSNRTKYNSYVGYVYMYMPVQNIF